MSLRNQKQVMAALDGMAGRSLKRAEGDYRREVIDPLVEGIEKAKSVKGLKRRLGSGLLRRMTTQAFEDRLAETLMQADMIGRVAGQPKGKGDE